MEKKKNTVGNSSKIQKLIRFPNWQLPSNIVFDRLYLTLLEKTEMYIHGWSLVVPFMIFTSKRNKVVIVGHYIASPYGKLFSYFNTVMPVHSGG